MIKRFMNWLGDSASSIATKYALRASVVIPFALAAGFAIAGLAVYLIELIGTRNAYFALATGFALLGIIAGWVIRLHEKHQEVEAKQAEAGRALATTATQVAVGVPAAMLKGTSEPRAHSSWAETLKGWPLYLVAIGLVLMAGQVRPQHARHP